MQKNIEKMIDEDTGNLELLGKLEETTENIKVVTKKIQHNAGEMEKEAVKKNRKAGCGIGIAIVAIIILILIILFVTGVF